MDLRFERVVRTEGHLGLRYADAREERASQLRDGLTLAKSLGGSDLLLVRKLPDGRLSVRRYGTQLEQLVSEVTLAMKASADEIRVAAHALATSRSGAIAATDATPESSPGASPQRSGDAFAGVVVVLGSVSSFALAWGTYAESMRFRGDVASDGGCSATVQQGAAALCIQSFARYQTLGDMSLAFGASAPPSASRRRRPRCPKPTACRFGPGLWVPLAPASQPSVRCSGPTAPRAQSTRARTRADPALGRLLVLHSPPLLAIPMTHGIRALLKSDQVQARASYSPAAAEVTITGRF